MSEDAIVQAEKNQALTKSIEYGESGMVIRTVEDLKNLAKWAVESGFLPEQIKTAQQAFVIMVSGAELGLKPMAAVKFLYLTKGRRVALMTKGALAVVQAKPTYDGYREWIEAEGKPEMQACAAAKRKGGDWQTKSFSVADAQVAGLLKPGRTRDGGSYDTTYQSFLKDMLLSRARGRVLDIVFAAELGGIPIEGVAEDADMMDQRRQGDRDEAPAPPQRRDPLIERLSPRQVVDTTAEEVLDPAFVTVVGVDLASGPDRTVVVSGPPPAAPPGPGKPADVKTLVRDKPKRVTTTPAGPGPGGGIVSPTTCVRCGHKLNEMGGCDVCGWPGDDIR